MNIVFILFYVFCVLCYFVWGRWMLRLMNSFVCCVYCEVKCRCVVVMMYLSFVSVCLKFLLIIMYFVFDVCVILLLVVSRCCVIMFGLFWLCFFRCFLRVLSDGGRMKMLIVLWNCFFICNVFC